MKRIEHLSAIAHDIGLVFQFLGVASLLPFVVLVIFQEWDIIIPMASAPATFFILGYLLSLTPRPDDSPPLSVTLVAVALSWSAIALVGHSPSLSDSICPIQTAFLRRCPAGQVPALP